MVGYQAAVAWSVRTAQFESQTDEALYKALVCMLCGVACEVQMRGAALLYPVEVELLECRVAETVE